MKFRSFMLAGAFGLAALVPAFAQDDAKIWFSWSPKPVPLTPWTAPNKPIWRLNEIMDAHKGKTDWVQPIVHDKDYDANYISLGAGQKTKPQFWADDRIFWYVASGQVRFHINGRSRSWRPRAGWCRCPIATSTGWRRWAANPACGWK